jgi:hypothetical protein
METKTGYEQSGVFKPTSTPPTTLTTSEVDLGIFNSAAYLNQSQISIYGSVTLGAVASATFYYYYSPDSGSTWYPVSLYNTSTGEITQRSVVVDAGTYVTGGKSLFLDSTPVAAGNWFKVTGKSATGTPAFLITVMGRNN